jgi:plastocyanin
VSGGGSRVFYIKSFAVFIFLACYMTVASAADLREDEFVVVIKDHVFIPEEVAIPAGKKVRLVVDNQDSTPEEFESHDLHREKIIKGNSKGIIMLGPLKPGEYKFFGEFNEKTAKGIIKVN